MRRNPKDMASSTEQFSVRSVVGTILPLTTVKARILKLSLSYIDFILFLLFLQFTFVRHVPCQFANRDVFSVSDFLSRDPLGGNQPLERAQRYRQDARGAAPAHADEWHARFLHFFYAAAVFFRNAKMSAPKYRIRPPIFVYFRSVLRPVHRQTSSVSRCMRKYDAVSSDV